MTARHEVAPQFRMVLKKGAYRVRLELEYPDGANGTAFARIDSNWPGMDSALVNVGGPNACLGYLAARLANLRRSAPAGPGFELAEGMR